MPPLVTAGAMLECSFGLAPAALAVIPTGTPVTSGTPAANVMSNAPMVNIPTFGMCTSLANPQVAAATSAALGVLTPQPCIPLIPAPWAPGATKVMVDGQPALHSACQAMCQWAGVITITSPGNKGTVTVT
jgi:hypothetical protein